MNNNYVCTCTNIIYLSLLSENVCIKCCVSEKFVVINKNIFTRTNEDKILCLSRLGLGRNEIFLNRKVVDLKVRYRRRLGEISSSYTSKKYGLKCNEYNTIPGQRVICFRILCADT